MKPKKNGNNNSQGKPKKLELKFHFNLRNLLLVGLILFFIVPIIFSFVGLKGATEEVSISTALVDIKEGKVDKVSIENNKVSLFYKDNKVKLSTKETSQSFPELLESSGVNPSTVSYTVVDGSLSRVWLDAAGVILPLLLMGAFFFFIFRQARGAQDTLFSFGQSKARLFSKGRQNVTFRDVAGVDEAKRELEEVVDFLKYPAKYRALGARTPKGVLLVGPPGTGKTLLARGLAGEAGVPFFSMAGSEFMEMLVGVGASRVRDLFAQAKKSSPAIIFIDEVESIGRARSTFGMNSHDEREQTLNQILVEMDGFTPNDNVVVVAASNRPDLLDPALMRPGRFDRRVMLDMPDKEGRQEILAIHARGKKIAKDINWERVASRTVGFSGADLENMLNEAAIGAARHDKKEIDTHDVEEAATKVKLGPAKKRLQTEEDKNVTAFHEAGHAIVTHVIPNMDPVHRISIVARGMSLGHTLIPPALDRSHETKSHLLGQITAMLGGRAAEEIVFGEVTTGAANDIESATRVTRHMVVDFGMSNLGPIAFGSMAAEEVGRMWESNSLSPAMQQRIDDEIKRIMDVSYKNARAIILKSRKTLDKVAGALMETETLEREEFEKIVGPKPKLSLALAK